MSDLNECALDRHFAAQLRDLQLYSKEHPVSQEDFAISQSWMKYFQGAKGLDKFARNCMLMLMFNQLREIGHLSKPFTEMENMDRSMDDLVDEYKVTAVVADVQETETNASNSGCYQEVSSEEPLPLPGPQFESIKQANQELLKEIDSLHSRTVETEKLYRCRIQVLEEMMPEKSMMGKPELVQEGIIQACRAAIDLLKDWPADTVRLNFLATCLEPMLRNELVTSLQIAELDLRLEDTLNSLVMQACSQRDDNVRKLYEQDKNSLKEKEEKLRRYHESLKQERQKLRLLSEDLRRREELIWRHQAIATLAATGLPPEDHSRCELCQREISLRTGPIHLTLRTRNCETTESDEDLQILSDALSDLSVDKC